MMKKLTIGLFLLALFLNVFSQNQMIARIEFEAAENAVNEEKYDEAYNRIVKTEAMLGKWSPNVSYLKIRCLDKMFDVTDVTNKYTAEFIKEVDQYMKFSNDNAEQVVLEKLKQVYEISKKTEYCKRNSVYQKDPLLLEGEAQHERKEYEAAVTSYLKSAEKGNCISMSRVGDLYRWEPVKINQGTNYSKAIEWYTKGAECGSLSAKQSLGDAYKYGWMGLTADLQKAFKYYESAAFFGYGDAIVELGKLYYYGDGVIKNYSTSYKLVKSAACQNNSSVIYWIGVHHRYGNYVSKDYNIALDYFKKAAELGQDEAMEEIGEIYEFGLGQTADKTEAIKWYTKAAQLGKASAQKKMFEILKNDTNKSTLQVAANWYEKAIENGIKEVEMKGDKSAYYVLGDFYKNKLGDDKLALKWFLKAAEKNNSHAAYWVVELYKDGKGTADKQLAKQWKDKYKKML